MIFTYLRESPERRTTIQKWLCGNDMVGTKSMSKVGTVIGFVELEGVPGKINSFFRTAHY
jgi:hypothetical protein